ncbi:hypothetical protein [uncultured Bartonella sp.]|uniref:hypothetical protein n=1 Tax=uncultured Bartonella sp. TaxID=104108 RepID=UPI00262E5777|nr:hypothetical protein [uncultured Bartonella sp.]
MSIEKEIGLNSLIGSMNEKFISKKELLFAGGEKKAGGRVQNPAQTGKRHCSKYSRILF